jgi:aminopeptidase N
VEPGADGTELVLSQRRFRYVEHSDESLWQVPVLLRASVGGEVVRQRVLLTTRETTITLPGKPDWVVVNAGGWGVYRVRYSPELLRALTTDLSHLDKLERFNLISDTWASVLAGTTAVAEFVELLRLFRDEDDPAVWGAIISAFGILRRVTPAADRPAFERFVRSLVRPQFDRLGWSPQPGESELDGELRGTLLTALGWYGADAEVQQQARAVHDQYLADPDAVDPNVAEAVASIVARTGGETEFQSFLDRWRQPSTPQEEMRYLYSLAQFPNPGLARRTLDMATTEVRTQNGPFLVAHVLAGPENSALGWAFIEEHWDELLEKFAPPLIPRMLDTVSLVTDPALAARIRSFIATHPLRSGQQTIDQALERMDVHVAFGQRVAAELNSAYDN